MRKLLALSYSFLILIQSFNIGLEDLSKFGILLEHAEYHKEMYGDSFFEFIAEHYGDAEVEHKTDHDEHQDLPFKDAHQLCSHISTAFINPIISFEFLHHEFISIPFNFFYTDSHTNFEKPSIFQPPKHA
ncbi:hypothetical protein DFQ11_101451 [Winogradskyella epiphytica]|uniref:Uncharacterized protein n=1 Tax=Winogradskyella epiphytica TaxID=262005 RepID=A0A2V4XI96_9FLAO|nr:hypothetical protein [Winogradskyella epiphytica]PYE83020.1 hypothetical protein DFQ11_101451 [Winogradskyella epiphytica]GGW55214.1 hypothetical protein GCM10008085_03190 [Winogradskyella epiphytica]